MKLWSTNKCGITSLKSLNSKKFLNKWMKKTLMKFDFKYIYILIILLSITLFIIKCKNYNNDIILPILCPFIFFD